MEVTKEWLVEKLNKAKHEHQVRHAETYQSVMSYQAELNRLEGMLTMIDMLLQEADGKSVETKKE